MTFFVLSNQTAPSYWAAMLPYHPKESLTERRERRKRDSDTLKAAGFKAEYKFHFEDTDSPGLKAMAKANAQRKAAQIEAKTGVKMEIVKGSYL